MSRNKQIDRLREGLKDLTGVSGIDDPVDSALKLIKIRKEEKKETNELFEALYNELVHAGLREDYVINRRDNTPITLGQLGFIDFSMSDHFKLVNVEDKVRLIAIVGMVVDHLRDLVLKERKIGAKTLKDAQEAAQSLLDSSYLTNTTFRTTLKDQDRALAECHRIIKDKDEERTYNLEVIKQLTGELEYQVAATKQYKRELELLYKDDIERSVNVAKFIFKD